MNKLQSLKCVEVTSQRQADNGTICYHDPITQCDYLSYESGYIRRSYKSKSYYSNKMFETIYQLNPKSKGYYKSEYTGKIYETTARVMIKDPKERMERLAKSVLNYRTYKNQQNQ